jgi:hypothetical protein
MGFSAISQMVEAGIEYVRIGEFMWTVIEPSPGVMDWSVLDKAVEVSMRHRSNALLSLSLSLPLSFFDFLFIYAVFGVLLIFLMRDFVHPVLAQHLVSVCNALSPWYGHTA